MRGIDFSHKITPRKVIFAQIQKNFPRISEAWKRFIDPDSEKELVYWSENQTFSDFYKKTFDS